MHSLALSKAVRAYCKGVKVLLIIRPGVLNNLKEARGIHTDQAMAAIGRVSLNTYRAYRDGERSPSGEFIAAIGTAFNMSVGELAVITRDAENHAA